jgi:CDGSH iron-sulfur domain-containing protein 2
MAEEISFNALVANLIEWKDRLVNNSVKSWEEMSAQRWIRIVVIVGAYLLIRPYLLSHAERSRKKREAKEAAELGLDVETELSPNDFRGGKKTKKGDEGLVQRSSLR